MKVNKKLIISKTILFIAIISFILVFRKIFGISNTLIGVTIITQALMLLERDFTISPIKYLIYLIGLNVFTGIASFIAHGNLWVGIPINFIVMFSIGFLLCYDLKSNMYLPFGLQYLFMLSVPIEKDKLCIRLISLALGSVFIIIVQLICNRNRLIKSGEKIIDSIFKSILQKIKLLISGKEISDLDKQVIEKIIKLKNLIYGTRKDSFYLTEYGRVKLNIVAIFENINFKVNELNKEGYEEYVLDELKNIYDKLYKILHNKRDVNLLENIKNEINTSLQIENSKINGYFENILTSLEMLCDSFIRLNNLKNYNHVNKSLPIPNEFNFVNVIKNNLRVGSLRFSYAFKVAFCVTIAIFIMDYFKIYEGRWMAYTVFSLIQPYSENSKIKSVQRVKGTLIGVMLFVVLFNIFKNPTIRSVIVIAAGYIDSYNTAYDRKMVCVTISALGVASINSSIGGEVFYRLFFVGAGVIVSLLVNKFIFPYSLEDANRDLINMSDSVAKKLLNEVKEYISDRNNNHSIENLFIIFSMIENKLILNKLGLYKRSHKQFLENKRKIIHNIYEVYMLAQNNKISNEDFKNLIKNNNVFYKANLGF